MSITPGLIDKSVLRAIPPFWHSLDLCLACFQRSSRCSCYGSGSSRNNHLSALSG
jgi:hypothetical protein